MKGTQIKVYAVVQVTGTPEVPTEGGLLAVKLTREAAQTVAKMNAPCKVYLLVADKSDTINGIIRIQGGSSDGTTRIVAFRRD